MVAEDMFAQFHCLRAYCVTMGKSPPISGHQAQSIMETRRQIVARVIIHCPFPPPTSQTQGQAQ